MSCIIETRFLLVEKPGGCEAQTLKFGTIELGLKATGIALRKTEYRPNRDIKITQNYHTVACDNLVLPQSQRSKGGWLH
ncbi:hypothetical protein RRG08_064309 [Elysia crispata]|uniref:Uncharacterized protein n=1 Tax=Elysia crispata TaxID=231223 RepID=A0AAE1E9S9_9GAST|nr:hypothetical protein RRG08_064309 [Elysia crispata]